MLGENMEGQIRLTIPGMEAEALHLGRNYTVIVSDVGDGVSSIADPEYEQFLADVWVGIVLTLMVLSCVCCMCSCLLYHKFQQWKRSVMQARRNAANAEAGQADTESLPSYTIVSGLPSYAEALEQLRQVHVETKPEQPQPSVAKAAQPPSEQGPARTPPPLTRLSVVELFQFYKNAPATTPTDTKT